MRKSDSIKRLSYSLAATFLGRMCLSGDILGLSDEQWAMISQAQGFYQNAKDVICNGRSYRFGPEVLSYRHPKGWQAVVRVSNDETKALAVIHTFASPVPEKIVFELPVGGNWEIKRKFASVSEVSFENGKIYITPEGEFSGLACILEKS